MNKLNSALATLVAIAAASPISAQSYRMDLTMRQELDLTALGAGQQTSDVNTVSFLTLTMRDSTVGQIATFVVDSVQITATGGNAAMFNQTLADSLKGATVTAHIVDGDVEGTPTPSVVNPVMNMAMSIANTLFAGVPMDAATRGTWSDTTTTNTVTEQGTTNSQQVTEWSMAGQEGEVLTLNASSTGTVNNENPGVQQMSGTITSKLNVVTAPGGPATSAQGETVQDLMLVVPQAPEPIPVKINTTAKVAVIP